MSVPVTVFEQDEAHLQSMPALQQRRAEERATLASKQQKAFADLAMKQIEQSNRLHSRQASEQQALSNRTSELQTKMQADFAFQRQQLQAVSVGLPQHMAQLML